MLLIMHHGMYDIGLGTLHIASHYLAWITSWEASAFCSDETPAAFAPLLSSDAVEGSFLRSILFVDHSAASNWTLKVSSPLPLW